MLRNTPRSRQSLVLPMLALLASGLALIAASALAAGPEICDGIDNDGDGQIDEGYDMDGDGVARCCDKRPYFVTTTTAGNQIRAHHNSCSNKFASGITPMAELPPGQLIRVNGVADIDGNGRLDTVWTDTSSGTRYLTTCDGGEWVTLFFGGWDFKYFGGADYDADGTVDFVWADIENGPVSGPQIGPGPDMGVTALWNGAGYTEHYNSWDVTPVIGEWVAAGVYNQEDLTSDGQPDMVFHAYSSGGVSTTELYRADGNGSGFDPAVSVLTIPNQPQNYGDLGDWNCDGNTDWIGGPDDDGNRGLAHLAWGDGAGGLTLSSITVDACPGSCPGSGARHGSGFSQLYDWNCDGVLDLLISHHENTGSTATVQYWEGTCDTFLGPAMVLSGAGNRARIASPLRN